MRQLALTLITILSTSCFYIGDPPKPGRCRENRDCPSGSVCLSRDCHTLCTVQGDCSGGQICGTSDVCVEPKDGPLPILESVAGNDPLDGTRIHNGITVTGQHLDDARFELRGPYPTVALAVTSSTAAGAELLLPVEVRSGAYQLVATNGSGEGAGDVTLTLPELDGETLLTRINDEATSTLAETRLPETVAFDADISALDVRATTLEATATVLTADVQALEAARVADGYCPRGYTQDAAQTDFILCTRGNDEMVKVGDFWVDRYEPLVVIGSIFNGGLCDQACTPGLTCFGQSSDNYPAQFPDNGNWTIPLYACSVSGTQPSRRLTWFQAQQACVLAGKHLITNAEWQAAVAGTVDPGASDGTGGACVTQAGGWRSTGEGSACRSIYGAEDMIGNLEERVADWYMEPGYNGDTELWAGNTDYAGDRVISGGKVVASDAAWGSDGSHLVANTVTSNHEPATLFRGGGRTQGDQAGAFYATVGAGVAFPNDQTFRCARSR